MTPKEKAQELVKNMASPLDVIKINLESKRCALIAVDEILSIKKEIWDDFHSEYFEFWQEVKQEIEEL